MFWASCRQINTGRKVPFLDDDILLCLLRVLPSTTPPYFTLTLDPLAYLIEDCLRSRAIDHGTDVFNLQPE